MTEKVTIERRDDMPMPLNLLAGPEDLAAWYREGLLESLEQGERALAIACFDTEGAFNLNLAAQAVPDERLVGLRHAQLPGQARAVDGTAGRSAGAPTVSGGTCCTRSTSRSIDSPAFFCLKNLTGEAEGSIVKSWESRL